VIVGNSWISPASMYLLLMILDRSLENNFQHTALILMSRERVPVTHDTRVPRPVQLPVHPADRVSICCCIKLQHLCLLHATSQYDQVELYIILMISLAWTHVLAS